MSNRSGRKIWVFIGILVIIGSAAFVFFDPLDLDLLGLKQTSVVVKHVPVSPAAVPAAKPPASAPAQALQPPLKLAKTIKTAKTTSQSGQTASKPTASKPANDKPERAKNLDLRHCLELETDAAIAKCAGE